MDEKGQKSLSIEQIEELKASFRMFDSDGDGRITKNELRTTMRNMGKNPTEQELNDMLAEVDNNGNGTIEYDEFVKMMCKRDEEIDEEEELRKSFKVFDRDGNGYIGLSELQYAMTSVGERMSEAEVKTMLQYADTDGDGQINYEEFVKMMTAK